MSNASPASDFVTDTMGLVLRLERRKLGPSAKTIFERLEAGAVKVYVPSMVFAEIMYLSAKRTISASLTDVAEYLRRYPNCKEAALDLSMVQSAAEITDIPELHDRLIAGTARRLNFALITNDPVIQASISLTTIW